MVALDTLATELDVSSTAAATCDEPVAVWAAASATLLIISCTLAIKSFMPWASLAISSRPCTGRRWVRSPPPWPSSSTRATVLLSDRHTDLTVKKPKTMAMNRARAISAAVTRSAVVLMRAASVSKPAASARTISMMVSKALRTACRLFRVFCWYIFLA